MSGYGYPAKPEQRAMVAVRLDRFQSVNDSIGNHQAPGITQCTDGTVVSVCRACERNAPTHTALAQIACIPTKWYQPANGAQNAAE